MKLSTRIKSLWLDLWLIAQSGLYQGRIRSKSAEMTAEHWMLLAQREPSDEEMQRLMDRILLFEDVHKRRPNEEETDVIIQQLLQFPS